MARTSRQHYPQQYWTFTLCMRLGGKSMAPAPSKPDHGSTSIDPKIDPKIGQTIDETSVAFANHIGVKLDHASPDQVSGRLTIRPELCNHGPQIHGGALMAFADFLGAIGAHLNLPDDKTNSTTVESKTNFLKSGNLGDTLLGTATPLSRGRRLSVWQTEITRSDGTRVAIVTQTQMYL